MPPSHPATLPVGRGNDGGHHIKQSKWLLPHPKPNTHTHTHLQVEGAFVTLELEAVATALWDGEVCEEKGYEQPTNVPLPTWHSDGLH